MTNTKDVAIKTIAKAASELIDDGNGDVDMKKAESLGALLGAITMFVEEKLDYAEAHDQMQKAFAYQNVEMFIGEACVEIGLL